jgi:hypothetical protein
LTREIGEMGVRIERGKIRERSERGERVTALVSMVH